LTVTVEWLRQDVVVAPGMKYALHAADLAHGDADIPACRVTASNGGGSTSLVPMLPPRVHGDPINFGPANFANAGSQLVWRVDASGGVTMTLRCAPASVGDRKACAGTLVTVYGRREIASSPFRIARGQSAHVRMQVSTPARVLLRRYPVLETDTEIVSAGGRIANSRRFVLDATAIRGAMQ
jgi:hypothetical protein